MARLRYSPFVLQHDVSVLANIGKCAMLELKSILKNNSNTLDDMAMAMNVGVVPKSFAFYDDRCFRLVQWPLRTPTTIKIHSKCTDSKLNAENSIIFGISYYKQRPVANGVHFAGDDEWYSFLFCVQTIISKYECSGCLCLAHRHFGTR